MPLSYLLDEHISYSIARQIQSKRPDIEISSVRFWRDGALQGQSDESLLRAATEDGYTLVTYDQKTIPPLLTEWSISGQQHNGVIFVDNRTVPAGDTGGLVRALILHWDRSSSRDRKNAIDFLRAANV